MEAELQNYLDTYESTHDYDEYHFDLDEIEHDPYVLMSICRRCHEGEWTLAEVQGTLEILFDRQYILTEDVVVEVRYRTETRTDSEGNTTRGGALQLLHLLCDPGKRKPFPPARLHHGRGTAVPVLPSIWRPWATGPICSPSSAYVGKYTEPPVEL